MQVQLFYASHVAALWHFPTLASDVPAHVNMQLQFCMHIEFIW